MITLRKRVEGNYETSGKYEEHLTPVWFLLDPLSRAFVKIARSRAVKEYGTDNG